MVPIFIGNYGYRQGPGYSYRRIVIPDPGFMPGRIISRMVIDQLGIVLQGLKSMGKTFGNIKRQQVMFREFHRCIF